MIDSQTHGFTIRSVNWSPDGKFLAVGGRSGDPDAGGPIPSAEIRVYEFDASTKTLTLRDSQTHGFFILSVNWSPDGKFLAVGGAAGTGGSETRVYEFDASTKTLTLRDSQTHGSIITSVNWSPDGKFLAVGEGVGTGGFEIRVFCALRFPSKNIIKDNVVYCTIGNLCPAGIGISGTSLGNLIVGNTAYENVKNYEFVTNVFAGGLSGVPTLLDNLSISPF